MKKFFFTIMSLCILLAGFSVQAEETSESQAFVLRIWDESNSGSKYMRFDIFLGEEPQAQFLACPDEGKDYIEIEIGTDSLYTYNEPDDLNKLRIECYLGYSDLSPEDAILEAYSGKDVNQKRIEDLELLPEFGQEYSFKVVEEGEAEGGFVLEAFEWKEETEEDSVSEEVW